ncbi:MAG TPA: polyprenyl synthetase family protein, partial [Nocardioidaceae bacterium]|nr:polyprenyl synthetase family protein [Nocardioidaceae bacterium]
MTSADTSWDDAAFRDAVQAALDTFIDDQARRLEPLGHDAARLVEAAHRSVAGGKRFRAAFCYWGYHAVAESTSDRAAVIKAAAALELLHASALVHDDYMDASDTRRGRPATHKEFEAFHREHGWDGDPEQYGAAAAILLGDLLLSWADEMLRTCGLDHDVVRAALDFFDTTRSEVIAGQFLDVSVQARGESDVDVAMRVLRYKSAKYPIERPLHVGAALAGADAGTLAALTGFGLPLGEAFQLRDDLLGVFGDSSVTGKPVGDDLREGKLTSLIAAAATRVDADGARLLEQLGHSTLDDSDIRALQRVLEASGARAEIETAIEKLV